MKSNVESKLKKRQIKHETYTPIKQKKNVKTKQRRKQEKNTTRK